MMDDQVFKFMGDLEEFNYADEWKKAEEKLVKEKDETKEKLKLQAFSLKMVPVFAKSEIVDAIDGKIEFSQSFIDAVHKYKKDIEKTWPKEIKEFVFGKVF